MSEREYTYSDRSPRRESERYHDDPPYRAAEAEHYDTRHADANYYRPDTRHYDDTASSHNSGYQGETLHAQDDYNDHYTGSVSEHVMYPGREFLDDHHYDHRTEPHFSDSDYEQAPVEPLYDNILSETGYSHHPANAPHTEEVWIKESQNRISYNDADLRDVDRTKISNYGTTLAGFAGVAAMLGLIGFLALSSAPDLTPEEIIAMQGYAGEQPIKTPFNLASLRDCDNQADCTTGETVAITSNADLTSQTTAETGVIPIAQTTTILNPIPTNANSDYIELQEIPAANTTYSDFTVESDSTTYSTGTDENQALQVLQQWSNVRREPNTDGAIITSLAIGTDVTMLSQSGEWYEISLNDRNFITGFMHRSTVAPK